MHSEHQRSWSFEVANVEQAAAWDGEEGEDWTIRADQFDAACRRYDPRLIDGAQIAVDDHVLDVGCGAGVSTRDAAQAAAAGHVLGVDLSARLIEEARRRSEVAGLANTTFVQGDAQVYPFDHESFEVAISRFGAMFFSDPVAGFANIGQALRPGGRLAVLAWQKLARNEWVQVIRHALAAGRPLPEPPPGAPGPFGLADKPAVGRILTAAGYNDIGVAEVSEPMYLGTDTDDAFAFVSGLGLTRGLLGGLDDDKKTAALEELRARLSNAATSSGVLLGASAWLITAQRAELRGSHPGSAKDTT
jgi:SAM-dependent methyltransferase